MLRQIGWTSNAWQAGFTKTIRLHALLASEQLNCGEAAALPIADTLSN
jgi:hypothetical protein